MTTRVKFVLASAIVVLAASSGGTAASQEMDDDSFGGTATDVTNGLWRDMDGKYWCGGECSGGQQCCRITLVAEE